ncbi:MAG: hypothetical protein LBQ83_04260 [Candidatus Margulisbacteria bacterium]|jgi:hypothetical protein|nr:hypothetical protein [Candidatus Margulisiibacteriota bacterium]
MSKAKYPPSVILDFKGGVFKRFSNVELVSYEGLKQIRHCLQQRRSVRIMFDGSMEPVKSRYLNFLSGLSGYFGAEMQVCR